MKNQNEKSNEALLFELNSILMGIVTRSKEPMNDEEEVGIFGLLEELTNRYRRQLKNKNNRQNE